MTTPPKRPRSPADTPKKPPAGALGWAVVDLREHGEAVYTRDLTWAEKTLSTFLPDGLILPLYLGQSERPMTNRMWPADSEAWKVKLDNVSSAADVLRRKVAAQKAQLHTAEHRIAQANLRARKAVRESRVGKLEAENRRLRAELAKLGHDDRFNFWKPGVKEGNVWGVRLDGRFDCTVTRNPDSLVGTLKVIDTAVHPDSPPVLDTTVTITSNTLGQHVAIWERMIQDAVDGYLAAAGEEEDGVGYQ